MVAEKQKKLIEMVSGFSDDYLDEELKRLKGDENLNGIVINPGSQNLFLSKDMIREVIFGR